MGPDYTNGRFAQVVRSREHDKLVKILGLQPLSEVRVESKSEKKARV
jgi:hypothetical protein